MEKFITCNGLPTRVVTYGDKFNNGSAILLLHGYLETLEVWEGFAKQQGRNFYTVTLDLPGHGLSGTHPEVNSMELMADVMHSALEQLSVSRVVVVGHSMGGYTALAFAKKYPEQVAGLCLMHSTPNPDSEEKKIMRDREIALIQEGKKELLIAQSIPMIFAESNVPKMYEAIADIESGASISDDEGTIACLRGMKVREDMNEFLKTFTKPLLFVFGKKDRHISFEVATTLMQRFPQAQNLILENSGHGGFIEEEKIVLEKIDEFVKATLQ